MVLIPLAYYYKKQTLENYHYIKELFNKYLNNTINKDEYGVLLRYFGKEEGSEEIRYLIFENLSSDVAENNAVGLKNTVDAVQDKLRNKLQPKKKLRLIQKYWPYAALALLGLAFALYFYLSKTQDHLPVLITDNQIRVNPGGDKATLVLDDGRTVLLDTVSNDLIPAQPGVDISKIGKGQLKYNATDIASRLVYNTIKTPNGGQYQVILPDNTHVWLNAASSIKFPTAFIGNSREVIITGEAYFEVAKNKSKPFRVKTADQTVEVLGTHFNVNSYADEPSTVTTLAEGSIRVNLSSSGNNFSHAMTIAPGQQTTTTKNNITIGTADLESALAWKNNQIYFKQASIQTIMRQVARWYNIDVEYIGKIPDRKFTGGIYRTDNLNDLLKILMLNDLHFELINNTLIVKP